MANEKQLARLEKGVDVWNKWRQRYQTVRPDLRKADLKGADLKGANLSDVDLSGADLSGANLCEAYLIVADLSDANLSEAILNKASLTGAKLHRANLSKAHLMQARLLYTVLIMTDLTLADLSGADLGGADLTLANLSRTNLNGAELAVTKFSYLDLSEVIGLEEVKHEVPSTIDIYTLQRSHGKIPEVFLRGCGLSDWEIEQSKLYGPDLSNEEIIQIQHRVNKLRATQALQISPLFISYSHADSVFVDKMESQLNAKGVRFWRDIHEMKAGKIEKQIDQAISQNRTVVLVLSEHSLSSDWVEHEVRTARELEKEIKRDVLCPVALDDSWKSSRWPKRIMEQIMEYNILDFSEWEDDVKFEGMFRKLIDGLELFYKG